MPSNPRTTIYANATFHTLDDARPRATALACDGEEIVAIGELDEVRALARPGATKVDLNGGFVVPGPTDAHIHLASYARQLHWVNLRESTSVEDAARRVGRHAAGIEGDRWILGGRWDFNWWQPPVPPDRRPLDATCPDRPAALESRDGHSVWVNGEALRRLGTDRDTPDPAGGEIVRDDTGEPTGLLREAAVSAVRQRTEAESVDQLPLLLQEAFGHMLASGLTGVHDLDGEDARAAYERLHDGGALPIRVYKSIPCSALDDAIAAGRRTGDGDSWLRTGPVKVFTDGALGSHTAAMLMPYAGEPANTGIEVTRPDALREIVRRACRARIGVAAHAIGDKANRTVLDTFMAAREEGPAEGLRFRIEHAQHLSPADLPRLARADVVASMQPVHCTSDIATAEEILAGHDVLSYAWGDVARSGASLAFGSDAPVEDPSPLAGIHAAITRRRPDGTPQGGWQPDQRVDVERALLAYTVGSAYASGEEGVKGRLRPGMLADFVVLPADPFDLPPDELLSLQVEATIVGGTMRWSRT